MRGKVGLGWKRKSRGLRRMRNRPRRRRIIRGHMCMRTNTRMNRGVSWSGCGVTQEIYIQVGDAATQVGLD